MALEPVAQAETRAMFGPLKPFAITTACRAASSPKRIKKIIPPGLPSTEEVNRVEVLNLSRDLHLQAGRIKSGDRTDATSPGQKAIP